MIDTLLILVFLLFLAILISFMIAIFWLITSRQQAKIKTQEKKIKKLSQKKEELSSRSSQKIKKANNPNTQYRDISEESKSRLSNQAISHGNQFINTAEFQAVLNLLNSDEPCVFITGKAGTGKSTLIREFVTNTNKSVVLLAPTGMAALLIGGQTLHSFFGFPPRTLTDEDIKPSRKQVLFQATDTIVIDEISMVRADLLDKIDQFLRLNGRDAFKPFGGIQMIFLGDLYQLPPISKEEEESLYVASYYNSPYFFEANVIRTNSMKVVELTRVFRQTDIKFLEALNAIRIGNASDKILKIINERTVASKSIKLKDFITLTTTNPIADKINRVELSKLSTPIFTYKGVVEGELVNKKKKLEFPADFHLSLKVGAQVIFVKNDLGGRWLNGNIGKVTELAQDYMRVEMMRNGERFEYSVDKVTWEFIKYNFDFKERKIKPEVVGKYIQYPLKLGWAITVHKSQGATFERVHIDLGDGTFAYGQAYVALSRCKSLEGITLERPILLSDIKTDALIRGFLETVLRQDRVPEHQLLQVVNTPRNKKLPNATSREKLWLKIDEEKYAERRAGNPSWWISDETNMVIPLYGDKTHGVDLRSFPGQCKIYINGIFRYTSNISDMMQAQALWKAIRNYQDVFIEPEQDCQIVPIS